MNVDDEMQLLLSLRNSCKPIRFLNYTTPNDVFKLTHSEYWSNDAKASFSNFDSKIHPMFCLFCAYSHWFALWVSALSSLVLLFLLFLTRVVFRVPIN